MKNKIKMIATDIDGTLLPFGMSRVPERVLRALQRALDEGIQVVPVSGRIVNFVPKELLELKGTRYVITCNGASIMDLKTGECVYRKGIPESRAAELLRMLKNYDVYTCVYLPDGPYNWSEIHPKIFVQYSNRLHFSDRLSLFRQNPREDLAAFLEEKGVPVDKIFVAVFSPEERDRIRRELSDMPGIHVTSSSAQNLEINHVEADKGRALSWLSRYLDIPAENILAMGDNENDYSMLTFAGSAIVPANGTDVIRKMATEIVPDCELCGTALYLERHVLNQN